jgi:hypothetical protein
LLVRPEVPGSLALTPSKGGFPVHAIGIDIGGTKIAGAVVDEFGAIVRSERVPTPRAIRSSSRTRSSP